MTAALRHAQHEGAVRATIQMWRSFVGLAALGIAVLLGFQVLALPPDTNAIVHVAVLGAAAAAQVKPAVALDTAQGYTYVAIGDGRHIAILDTRTGALRRTLSIGGLTGPGIAILTPWLAVDPAAGHLFVLVDALGFTRPVWRLFMLDTMSGRVLRTVTLPTPPTASWYLLGSPITVDPRDGHVFVNSVGTRLLNMFDARTGRLLRSITIGPASQRAGQPGFLGTTVDEQTHRVFVSDVSSGTVTVLDALSGRVLRVVVVGPDPGAPAIDAQAGQVIVSSSGSGRVSALDARTGRLLHVVDRGASGGNYSVIDGSTERIVNISAAESRVDMRSSMTWRLLQSVSVRGRPIDMAVDGHSGAVFVLSLGLPPHSSSVMANSSLRVSGFDTVTVLDGQTGTIRRTIAIAQGDGLIFIDARLGRAVVVTSGGSVPAMQDPWGWVPLGLRRVLPLLPRPIPRQTGPVITATFIDIRRL